MTLTSLLNGAAQTTGNRIPPMFQSIGVIGIRKTRKQDRKSLVDSQDSTVLPTGHNRENTYCTTQKYRKQNKEQRTVGIRAVRLVSLAA